MVVTIKVRRDVEYVIFFRGELFDCDEAGLSEVFSNFSVLAATEAQLVVEVVAVASLLEGSDVLFVEVLEEVPLIVGEIAVADRCFEVSGQFDGGLRVHG